MRDLEKYFPILDISGNCLLNKQGAISVGYALQLPEIFTLGERDYAALHETWIKALQSLPVHSMLCKQDWFTREFCSPENSADSPGFTGRASRLHFMGRPYLEHRCYLFISQLPGPLPPESPMGSSLLKPGGIPSGLLSGRYQADFLEHCQVFRQILEDSGFLKLQLLEADDYSGNRTPGLWERYLTLNPAGHPGMLGDLSLQGKLQIGSKHARMFTLGDARQLPEVCGPRIDYEPYSSEQQKLPLGFASCMGQLLDCDHLYSQYIWTGDPSATLKAMERKRRRMQSFSAYSRENRTARDSIHAFLEEAVTKQRQPVKAHYNLLIWSQYPEKLQDLTQQVAAAFTRISARAKEETHVAAQLYWAGIPGNAGDLPMSETFDTFTGPALCFFNMESTLRQSLSPVGIRLGERLSGRPLHVDLSDEPIRQGICMNRNKFILGPSGSGKSFFTNHMLRSCYHQGAHIVLIDVGHSYKGLCQLLDGYYFSYSDQQPICFNPFLCADTNPDTEKKESLKTLLLALWKNDQESSTRSEYVALSNAISDYYRYLGDCPEELPGFNSFYEFLQSHYRRRLQLESTRQREFDIDNFLYVLRPYYKGGEFDFLLNASLEQDMLSQRFIVFELDTIKDHPILFPVVTLIIMDVFISKMRRLKGIRKMILIEEAWKALMTDGFARYVRYLFKTVRKFYGEAIVVTQEIDDIISSPIVKQTVINNSDCKILLDQRKYRGKFSQIQALLALSEQEKALALSVNKNLPPSAGYKEVFISLGGICSKVYRTEVSLEEYLLYTTEEKEKQRVEHYGRKYGGLQSGITALARDIRAERRSASGPDFLHDSPPASNLRPVPE